MERQRVERNGKRNEGERVDEDGEVTKKEESGRVEKEWGNDKSFT